MYCPNCGKALPDDAAFCDSCGAKIGNESQSGKICSGCGMMLKPEETFCPKCGTPAQGAGGYRSGGSHQGGYQGGYSGGGSYHNPNKEKSNTVMITAIVAVAVVVIAVCAVVGISFYMTHSTTEDVIAVVATEIPTEIPAEIPTEVPAVVATEVPVEAPTQAPADNQTVIVQVPASVQAPPAAPAAPAGGQSSSSSGDFLYNSASQLITRSYLSTKSQKEVRLILNEMYARHGYIFSNDEYRSYFSSKSWYVPRYTSAEQVEGYFNSTERTNKETIVAYEKDMGYR